MWQQCGNGYDHRARKIRIRRYSDSNRPHLKFVVGYRETGKRKRSFFETKEQAESFAAFKNAELKRNGVEHAEFPTALRVMAQQAVEKMLELLPKPPPEPEPENDSDEQRRQRKKRMADACKIVVSAVDEYVARWRASERSCTAVQLVRELVAAKKADGASMCHLSDLRSRLNIFAKEFDGQMVATITSAEIDDWLRSLNVSPVTRNHYRRLIILAFNFAVQRKYATENPAVETAEAREPKTKPGILKVDEGNGAAG